MADAQKDLVFMPRLFGDRFYPGGFPMYPSGSQWQGNIKDDLVAAIRHYHELVLDKTSPPLSEYEFQLINEFCIYFIEAPVWASNCAAGLQKEYARAVKSANEIKDRVGISQFIYACMSIGLDPFF